ncbi:MAG: CbtA family protein [Hyphomicrobiales bacterium]|nr:CbtA family protein [Hyphomicrobiales bacterium]
MITRVLFAAILAGIAAGLVMSVIQHVRVTPLILQAETFEAGPAATSSDGHDHSHGDEAWAPAAGFERTAFTFIANIVTGAAFGLVLAGAAMLTGLQITTTNGALWGLMGFLAFTLSPSAGLPPELPGMPAADLLARQVWWWLAVAGTAAGIGLMFMIKSWGFKALGICVIALPHIVGAPHAADTTSNVPAALATAFAANSIATAAVFWIVLGVLLGYMLSRTVTQNEATQ